jgi:protein TonB
VNTGGRKSADRWVALIISAGIHLAVILAFFAFWSPTVPEPLKLELELSAPIPLQSTQTPAPQVENAAGVNTGEIKAAPAETLPQPKEAPGALPPSPPPKPSTPAGTENTASPAQPAAEPSGEGAPAGMTIAPPRLKERPVPVKVPDAARAGMTGTVQLTVEILEDGRIGKIVVEQSSGSALLDKAARENVAGWKLEPARLPGGKPVRVLTAVWLTL